MKATQGRWISASVAVISIVLLVATLVLPGVRTPQTAGQTVPYSPGSATNPEIYGYGIPTVANGSTVTVKLSGFQPFSLEYTLSPTKGDLLQTAIAFGGVGNSTVFSFTATAQGTYPLELFILDYNGSAFTISYSGTWSPFDFLAVYAAPAVFLIFASLAGTYYFDSRVPRQRNEEKVEAELEQKRKEKNPDPQARP